MTSVEAGMLRERLAQVDAQTPEAVLQRIVAANGDLEAAEARPGLAIGAQAPEFSLPNATGQPVSLSSRVAAGPVVLVFYRGEWCPYCNVYLRALQAALPEITARGASLLAVSPQSPDHSLSITEKAELGFDVLSDVDQAVIRAYGLQFTVPADIDRVYIETWHTDLRQETADGTLRLSVPATLVIDGRGIVRAGQASHNYRARMDPADIVAALDALN